jgi:hypothetical protein
MEGEGHTNYANFRVITTNLLQLHWLLQYGKVQASQAIWQCVLSMKCISILPKREISPCLGNTATVHMPSTQVLPAVRPGGKMLIDYALSEMQPILRLGKTGTFGVSNRICRDTRTEICKSIKPGLSPGNSGRKGSLQIRGK